MPILATIYLVGVVIAFIITMPIGFYLLLEEQSDDPFLLCMGALGVILVGALAAFAWPAPFSLALPTCTGDTNKTRNGYVRVVDRAPASAGFLFAS